MYTCVYVDRYVNTGYDITAVCSAGGHPDYPHDVAMQQCRQVQESNENSGHCRCSCKGPDKSHLVQQPAILWCVMRLATLVTPGSLGPVLVVLHACICSILPPYRIRYRWQQLQLACRTMSLMTKLSSVHGQQSSSCGSCGRLVWMYVGPVIVESGCVQPQHHARLQWVARPD